MTSRFHPARVIGSSLRLRMRKYYCTPCGLQPQVVQRKRIALPQSGYSFTGRTEKPQLFPLEGLGLIPFLLIMN